MESFWNWRVIPDNLGFFAGAFRLTLTIFVLAWIGCWAFAVVFGAMRHSSRPWLSYPAAAVIEILRGTHRYRVTPLGLRCALFLTKVRTRILSPGLSQTFATAPTADPQLKASFDQVDAAINDLVQQAKLVA